MNDDDEPQQVLRLPRSLAEPLLCATLGEQLGELDQGFVKSGGDGDDHWRLFRRSAQRYLQGLDKVDLAEELTR